MPHEITEAEIRKRYEPALWAALDHAVTLTAIHAPDRLAQFTQLTEELGKKGWGIRLVFGPPGTDTRGIHFFRAPKDWPKGREKELPIEAMTDRELLLKLSDMVSAYDRRRDDELEYLDKHPVRDAWDDEQRAEYKEICDDIREQYSALRELLDHISSVRKPPCARQDPEVR